MDTLEPKSLWNYFQAICAIPHPSHHEETLARWILETAKNLGFEARARRLFNNHVKCCIDCG
ncbi:MAG TPA: hypothetical protein PLJ83_13425, partial [Spirochaetales bacterium]|nr:hypothetical protein [Spirochaetales bacterium]